MLICPIVPSMPYPRPDFDGALLNFRLFFQIGVSPAPLLGGLVSSLIQNSEKLNHIERYPYRHLQFTVVESNHVFDYLKLTCSGEVPSLACNRGSAPFSNNT